MATKKRKTPTKYQRLVKAKAQVCKGRKSMTDFNKVASAYVKDAVKKGNKTKSQAEAVVNKLKRKACATKAKAKTASRKRKTTRKKR